MLVEIDLGVTGVVHQFHPVPRFHEVSLKEISIIVVACIVVV